MEVSCWQRVVTKDKGFEAYKEKEVDKKGTGIDKEGSGETVGNNEEPIKRRTTHDAPRTQGACCEVHSHTHRSFNT